MDEKEGKHYDRLTPKEWVAIFEHVKRGTDRKEVQQELKKHHTTVYRAYGVAERLINRDRKDEPTASEMDRIINSVGYETSESYVLEAFNRYEMWLLRRQKSLSENRQNILALGKIASQVRNCLHKPSKQLHPDFHKFLYVGGQDWRLDPKMWFFLCTPSFKRWRNNWSELFPSFRYLTRKGFFWKNYGKLWKSVLELERQYQIAVIRLGQDFDEFRDIWMKLSVEKLMRETGELPRPYCYPDSTPEDMEWFEPGYDCEYSEEVLKRFYTVMGVELEIRYFELEELLAKLNRNMEPRVVKKLIENAWEAKASTGKKISSNGT